MNILIDLGGHVMREAFYELLARSGHESVVVIGKSPANAFIPDVLLVDERAGRIEPPDTSGLVPHEVKESQEHA